MKNEIIAKIDQYNLNQYQFLVKEEIIFSQEVLKMCEANSCGKYGTNWMCPPATGSLEEMKAKCLSYDNILLFNMVYKLEDSFDFEGMMDAGNNHRKISKDVANGIREIINEKPLILGPGGCTLCDRCTYLDGESCINPEEAISGVESHGILIAEYAPKIGFKYINGPNTVTYFTMLLWNNN